MKILDTTSWLRCAPPITCSIWNAFSWHALTTNSDHVKQACTCGLS